MKIIFSIFIFTSFFGIQLSCQDTIRIKNSSFEGKPRVGAYIKYFLKDWLANEAFDFSHPDLHGSDTHFFNIKVKPYDGNTFVGMVTREDETFEEIGQYLFKPLKKDVNYQFSIFLCYEKDYLASTKKIYPKLAEFGNPIALSIYGYSKKTKTTTLLAKSELIDHSDWKEHNFKILPKEQFDQILFRATPPYPKYYGNIFLDKMSDIIEITNKQEN